MDRERESEKKNVYISVDRGQTKAGTQLHRCHFMNVRRKKNCWRTFHVDIATHRYIFCQSNEKLKEYIYSKTCSDATIRSVTFEMLFKLLCVRFDFQVSPSPVTTNRFRMHLRIKGEKKNRHLELSWPKCALSIVVNIIGIAQKYTHFLQFHFRREFASTPAIGSNFTCFIYVNFF